MKSQKVWGAKDAARCIVTPSDLDHKYSRGVLGIITGIGAPITASDISSNIQEAIRKLLK